MNGQIALETERLTLRRITRSDLDHLFELDSDPEVMRFLTGGKPAPRSVIENEDSPPALSRVRAIPRARPLGSHR